MEDVTVCAIVDREIDSRVASGLNASCGQSLI